MVLQTVAQLVPANVPWDSVFWKENLGIESGDGVSLWFSKRKYYARVKISKQEISLLRSSEIEDVVLKQKSGSPTHNICVWIETGKVDSNFTIKMPAIAKNNRFLIFFFFFKEKWLFIIQSISGLNLMWIFGRITVKTYSLLLKIWNSIKLLTTFHIA